MNRVPASAPVSGEVRLDAANLTPGPAPLNVGDVTAALQRRAPPPSGGRETCDRLVTGSAAQPVRAIAVTFLATQPVLRRAVDRGVNLIVTYEPTFYRHDDETDWLEGDPVFAKKRRFIAEHRLAIWRFHDACHALRPDPIAVGFAAALGWSAPAAGTLANGFEIAPCLARELNSSIAPVSCR